MKVIHAANGYADISLTVEELLVLNSALNEVCNGIELFEFETRVGVDQAYVLSLLKEVGQLLDNMES